MPPRRSPKAGDGSFTAQVPTDKLGLIIGRGGATLTRIEGTYDVKVNIPSKEHQTGLTTPVHIEGQRVQECVMELARLCGVADGPDFGAHGGAHGGPAPMGASAGAGGTTSQVFLFRASHETRELQLLLQCHPK